MKRNALLVGVVVGVCGAPRIALAQPQPIVLTYSINWDNGVTPLQPTAKGGVYVGIYPSMGTLVTWNSPTPQVGPIKAFASSIIDVTNITNGLTGTLSWTIPTPFDLKGMPGKPDGGGGIADSMAGQLSPPSNTNPVVKQVVKVLDLTWTTTDFTPRPVTFGIEANSGRVFIDIGLPNGAWADGDADELISGSTQFLVTPEPGVATMLMLAGGVAGRRQRR